MLDEHLHFLACPHCTGSLRAGDGHLSCARGHSFDVARQGHVSLLGGRGRTVPGDTPGMVAARGAFLAAGHFDPIAESLSEAGTRVLARAPASRCVIDAGAGTGFYLDRLGARIDHRPGLIAVDISRAAMRHAARTYPRLAAVVADIRHRIPVVTGSAALVLDAFAPRNPAEIDRVLAPEGALTAVIPDEGHLRELVETFGLLGTDPAKRERLARALDPFLTRSAETGVSFPMRLSPGDVGNLVRMGPSARHRTAAEIDDRLARLPAVTTVTAAVRVLTYHRRVPAPEPPAGF